MTTKTEPTNILTHEEATALKAWAQTFPKAWEKRLMSAWLTGNYSGVKSNVTAYLQQIRNRTLDAEGRPLTCDLTQRMKILAGIVESAPVLA